MVGGGSRARLAAGGGDPPAEVLLLGDPRLRLVSVPVESFHDRQFHLDSKRLHATLAAFRRSQGFGRAIASPQIGVARRVIALSLGSGPITMVNPIVTHRSRARFTMWDDCMSFPSLLVRLRRCNSISVVFFDQTGARQEWSGLERAVSELLQHEIDHLDGILAVDRAIDRDSIVMRELFDAQRDRFIRLADYVIEPPT